MQNFYDFIYYIGRNVPVNLKYLEQKMRVGGNFSGELALSRKNLIDLYLQKIETTDFESAKADAAAFVFDDRELDLWSKDFFISLAEKITVE